MATGKRYYWIKLKESFMTSDTVDYLMSQPDGANYVVLYQMLCLKTINTGGKLSRQIGEMVIPYDVEKIQRDCKWFSVDTIRVALNLYKSFGLIYEDIDGVLVMSDHGNLVGSETDWGEKKRRQRNAELPSAVGAGDIVPTSVPQSVHQSVPTDIRDKILDNRDKRLDNRDIESINDGISGASAPAQDLKGKKTVRFVKPTVEEIADYCAERKNGIDPQRFFDYYESNGWMVGKTHMKDWKAAVRNWEGRGNEHRSQNGYNARQESTPDRIARMIKEGRFDDPT